MRPYMIQAANSSLYRVVYPSGSVSDLLNLSRAKDVLAEMERQFLVGKLAKVAP